MAALFPRSGVSASVFLACFATASVLLAQPPTAVPPVPNVMWFSGTFRPANGLPIAPVEVMTVAIYQEQAGGAPLWQETQNLVVRADGRYDVLLGSTTTDGLPRDLFATGDPRWVGVRVNRTGETEQPRVALASVPYALRAADADTLGGYPVSAFLLAPTGSASTTAHAAATASTSTANHSNGALTPSSVSTNALLSGTPNFVAKYATTTDVGPSALFENNGVMGLGTTTPFDLFHVRFTNTNGGLTGFAVQNLGNTATSYSGMLFYDQNGALGQFQGFNNVTHEYRINNVASGGFINFMIGSSSKFLVNNNGNVGIGIPNPGQRLSVAGTIETTSGGIKFPDGSIQNTAAPTTVYATAPPGIVDLTNILASSVIHLTVPNGIYFVDASLQVFNDNNNFGANNDRLIMCTFNPSEGGFQDIPGSSFATLTRNAVLTVSSGAIDLMCWLPDEGPGPTNVSAQSRHLTAMKLGTVIFQ
jgi:hypothetical protein